MLRETKNSFLKKCNQVKSSTERERDEENVFERVDTKSKVGMREEKERESERCRKRRQEEN